MPAPIDFWFSIGSTYTYLSVMRIRDVAQRSNVTFRWRPFNARAIMLEMNNIPFATKPMKAKYMWRDVERRAALYGIPWTTIPPYPLKDLSLPNRIALLGVREGWGTDYVVAAYRRWFTDGQDASMEPNIPASLREAGQDPARVIPVIESDELKTALQHETAAAQALGIFGAPTFAVGEEIFWGDDRLSDAIDWHRHGGIAAQNSYRPR